MRSLVPAMVALALLGTACSSPDPTATAPALGHGAATSSVSGQGFALELIVRDALVAEGEAIDAQATLANETGEAVTLSGSGMGLVFFSVTRADGLGSGPPVIPGDCARHSIAAGERVTVPFAKSGAWSPDDPNAAFLRAYFEEPELRLPPGSWRIDAMTRANVGEDCGGDAVHLETSVEVTVTEGG